MTPFEAIKQKYKPLLEWSDNKYPVVKLAGYRMALLCSLDGVTLIMIPGHYTRKDLIKFARTGGDIITMMEVLAQRPGTVEIDFSEPDSLDRFDAAMRHFAFLASARPANA